MSNHTKQIVLSLTILGTLFFAGCGIDGQDRVLMEAHTTPNLQTKITKSILSDASRFKENTYANNSMPERLEALQKYSDELNPLLTDSFGNLFNDYVTAKIAAFKTEIPYSRFDKAQDDPILQRRWEPDAVVISVEGNDEKPNESVVVVNELLLDGKIYTGYRGETRMTYKRINGVWLLDDVVVRRRYSYNDWNFSRIRFCPDDGYSFLVDIESDVIYVLFHGVI